MQSTESVQTNVLPEPLTPIQLQLDPEELQLQGQGTLELLQPLALQSEEAPGNILQPLGGCTNCKDQSICNNCISTMNISYKRAHAKKNLEKQATKMLKYSNSKFPHCQVGDTVRVAIPDVDRGRGDFRNILMAILEIDDNGFYKLGNYSGTIEEKFSRNQFFPTNALTFDLTKISKEKKSLRQLATLQSKFGGQGYQRCNCKGGCSNNRCKCKSNGFLCNSKCHGSLPCQNK